MYNSQIVTNRCFSIAALSAVACLILLCCPQSIADVPRPNILYFYVDDMGWGSIGPNGQAERKAKGLPYVRTPNIDRLAAQGVNFRRGYACHVCSPSRASQQCGFHQGHTFADRNDPDNARKAMRADDVLIGDALSLAGYETAYQGKWGFGGSKDQKAPVIDNVQTLPTSHGYKHVLAELHHVRAHTFFSADSLACAGRCGSHRRSRTGTQLDGCVSEQRKLSKRAGTSESSGLPTDRLLRRCLLFCGARFRSIGCVGI